MPVDEDDRLVLLPFGNQGIELRLDRDHPGAATKQRRLVERELIDEFGAASRDLKRHERARCMTEVVATTAQRFSHRPHVAPLLSPPPTVSLPGGSLIALPLK